MRFDMCDYVLQDGVHVYVPFTSNCDQVDDLSRRICAETELGFVLDGTVKVRLSCCKWDKNV